MFCLSGLRLCLCGLGYFVYLDFDVLSLRIVLFLSMRIVKVCPSGLLYLVHPDCYVLSIMIVMFFLSGV
jgi:hypothetical protein